MGSGAKGSREGAGVRSLNPRGRNTCQWHLSKAARQANGETDTRPLGMYASRPSRHERGHVALLSEIRAIPSLPVSRVPSKGEEDPETLTTPGGHPVARVRLSPPPPSFSPLIWLPPAIIPSQTKKPRAFAHSCAPYAPRLSRVVTNSRKDSSRFTAIPTRLHIRVAHTHGLRTRSIKSASAGMIPVMEHAPVCLR